MITWEPCPACIVGVRRENHFDEKWFILLPHVLGPKYERLQRPRNSKGFLIGESQGDLSHDPDVVGSHLLESLYGSCG